MLLKGGGNMIIEPEIKGKYFTNTKPRELIVLSLMGDYFLGFVYEDIDKDEKVFKGFIAIYSLVKNKNIFKYFSKIPTNLYLLSLGENYRLELNPFLDISFNFLETNRETAGLILVAGDSKFISIAPSNEGAAYGYYNLDTGKLDDAPEVNETGYILNWKVKILGNDKENLKTINEISINLKTED
jgi:hypothetical protein